MAAANENIAGIEEPVFDDAVDTSPHRPSLTLPPNVGAIAGITSALACENETVAASIKVVNQLNSNLEKYTYTTLSTDYFDFFIQR